MIRSLATGCSLGLLLLLAAGFAQAQETRHAATTADDSNRVSIHDQRNTSSTASLSQQIKASQNPDQLYQLGLDALAGNQPDVARQALERVISINPRFAGAWLDLALATYRTGDAAAAVEHLEYLRSQFTLSPAVTATVNYWLNQWQNPSQNAAQSASQNGGQSTGQSGSKPGWQGEVQLGAGYDNNANTGLAPLQIPLSLPTGRTLFDVDQAFLPRADSFSLLALTAGGPALALGKGKLSPVLVLRRKQFTHETGFSTLDLQPGLVYQQAVAPETDGTENSNNFAKNNNYDGINNWQVNLLAQHYQLGHQTLFNSLRLAVQRNQPWHTCQRSTGTEIESRHQKQDASLGGTLYSLNAGLSCPLALGGNKAVLSTNLKTGIEQARGERAGNGNRSTELTVRYELPLSASQSLQATWQIAHTVDQTGYSPLLENNATRQLQRQTLSLGLRQSLSNDWEARLNLEYFQQRANLPLFEQQGQLLMIGLARRFN